MRQEVAETPRAAEPRPELCSGALTPAGSLAWAGSAKAAQVARCLPPRAFGTIFRKRG